MARHLLGETLDADSKVLRHKSCLDRFDAHPLDGATEVSQPLVGVEFRSLSESSWPRKDGGWGKTRDDRLRVEGRHRDDRQTQGWGKTRFAASDIPIGLVDVSRPVTYL